ncbi:acyltransferase family protein [Nocardiopsis sp. N85]|uniref:acyltransferase family protein n=1 Tax=Nocardiopsis sp. N85 TaxID=3029400 RepID=UPI00237F8EE2|nr:acyltransferase family protein [Nocardiopsis sp. N85]MDE3722289.1 acyltransferase family protein [Nocardiopsis sp. N85]
MPEVRRRRDDIEGLRGIAALLIAVYHIWFGTVSGGVDVFLILTGFLITGSMVRALERDGRIGIGAFWSRTARRLFPAGAVVLGAVLIGAFLFLPRSGWTAVIADVRAAALYHVNWHLALGSVDYMARDSASSPVQHFWSLGVQGQFYLLWPILLTLVALAAVRLGGGVRTAVTATVTGVFALSFGYSLWITSTEPTWAYFDTGARLWEPALGGLLALLMPYLRVPRAVRAVAGWIGLLALISCGVIIGDSLPYPGYASLWPITAAVLILVAGADGEPGRWSANRLLGLRPLTWLGRHSFTLFLWHWPVLVFYLEVTNRVKPSMTGGLMVLGASFAAALATSWIVDGGVDRVLRDRRSPSWSLAAGVLFAVPVLLGSLLWNAGIEHERELRARLSADPTAYPGAAVHLSPELAASLPSLPVYPDTTTVKRDTISQTSACNVTIPDAELISCEFGAVDSEYTLVLTGSSHARHWFQALLPIAEHHGWRLVIMTKNACQFSAEEQVFEGAVYEECNAWNDQVTAELERMRPNAVFTLGTLTQQGDGSLEHVPAGFVEHWRWLEERGIDVVAVRDTPRFSFDVADCVDRAGAGACAEDRAYTLAEVSPLEEAEDLPAGVRVVDLSDYLCRDGRCPGVIGNQLAYYDDNHFSYAFSSSLAVLLEPLLLEALPDAPVADTTLADHTSTLIDGRTEAAADPTVTLR